MLIKEKRINKLYKTENIMYNGHRQCQMRCQAIGLIYEKTTSRNF